MKTKRYSLVIVAALLTSACATKNAVPPLRGALPMGSVPEGLTYLPKETVIIESETVRAGRLLYRSRIEPGSLAQTLQGVLEEEGWRLVRNTFIASDGTTQLYARGDSSLQVRLWEGGLFGWYTYLELSGSQPASRGAAAAATTR